ncbi:MerR family transcriptional regulator [uncultured Flavobacterium sp.]|uniref:MerR family transcriptional regulator n=1 Tax=uncultured Flavobacterium sp. TaxID=165435 RepID=UPI0027E14A33|nr:MerR family transcriptional regulator [uncultured Flavobacterium sp.]
MNNIKTVFSIGDLEGLSGVKAHTIRIWEKRYGLLSPERSENNLRYYGLDELRKLLNVVLLTGYGVKISKVAKMRTEEIEMMVGEIRVGREDIKHTLHLFKLAMMTFDQPLFLDATDHLLAKMPFERVFNEYYIPFLQEIGLMWQAGTIQPAHEHFISCLIRMVLIQQISLCSRRVRKGTLPAYVLFLPFGEIHELGLMFLQYLITSYGHGCVYLGSSIPLDSLSEVTKLFRGVTFITYMTVLPEEKPLDEYVEALLEKVRDNHSQLWIVGRRVAELTMGDRDSLTLFTTLQDIAAKLS